jgi:hypothetical protein
MTNCGAPNQAADNLFTVKIACDMTHCSVGVEIMAVKAAYTSRFLSPVLKGMKAKRHHSRGALSVIDAKDPALFTQFVVIKRVGGQHLYRIPLRFAGCI